MAAKKRILVVDDEEDIREVVSAILDHEGFEVACADSGYECLRQLTKVKPDLILMDMMMPGMSGREAVEKIRADKKIGDVKIAFLTVAKFSEIGQYILRKMNVLDYIAKPFDNGDLVRRVKKMLDPAG